MKEKLCEEKEEVECENWQLEAAKKNLEGRNVDLSMSMVELKEAH